MQVRLQSMCELTIENLEKYVKYVESQTVERGW